MIALTKHITGLPASIVSPVISAIADPAVLMALTVMVYLLSSLRPSRVSGITEVPVMSTVSGPPVSKHLLTV